MALTAWPPAFRYWPLIHRVLGVVVTLVVVCLLLFQVSFNVSLFAAQPTIFAVTMEPNPQLRLPPLTVCPKVAFEPTRVKDLGLDIPDDYINLQENLYTLQGISGNMSVKRLWSEASWYIGQLIRYVKFNNNNIIIYSDLDTRSSLWRYSLSPFGRCLTLLPPIGETYIEVVANIIPYSKPCQWVDENGVKYHYFPYQSSCDLVVEKCNSSCSLEDYIYYSAGTLDYAYIYFHGTSVIPIQDDPDEDMKLSSQLFDGHYVLKKLFRSPTLNSIALLIDSSLVKGPCISDKTYSYGNCYRQFLTKKMLEKHSCRPVMFPLISDVVQDYCYSPELMTKLFIVESELITTCKRKCKETKWRHVFSESYDGDYTITLQAASTEIRRELEINTYPVSQLASDTGGSLGLFLGVSLLHFWDGVVYLLRAGNTRYSIIAEHTLQHACHLLLYSGITIMSMATVVHSMVVMNTFISQSQITSVSLRMGYNKSDHIDAYIARRLSSRVFDCRPYESDVLSCQVNCMLEDAVNDLSSLALFINVDELPPCEGKTFSVPAYDHIVSPAMLTVATHATRKKTCQEKCHIDQETENATISYSRHMEVNTNYYTFDILSLLCSLGGIVGLYLGYSVADAADVCKHMLSSRFVQALKGCIFMFGLTLGLWQAYNFLLHHQMTTSFSKAQQTTDRSAFVLTVCRWPPYDFTRIVDLLGYDMTKSQILRLPSEERLPEVMKIINLSVGNLSIPLDELWEKSAWSIADTISVFMNKIENGSQFGHFCDWGSGCAEVWKPVVTLMNRCYSMNLSHEDSALQEVILLFPSAQENGRIFGFKPQFYFSVHSYDEHPLLSNMIFRRPAQRATSDLHSVRYQSLSEAETASQDGAASYGTCVHECIGHSTVEAFGCRLPFVPEREDADLCNQSQYAGIPAYFKGLDGIGAQLADLESSENTPEVVTRITKSCYAKCRHFRKTFSTVSMFRETDFYPTITLRIRSENQVTVTEEDSHSLARLLSDLGGVASSTVGFSLLYLVKNLLDRIIGTA
nr:uncharacterized protein LOC113814214 [Penaeus vannamei]